MTLAVLEPHNYDYCSCDVIAAKMTDDVPSCELKCLQAALNRCKKRRDKRKH